MALNMWNVKNKQNRNRLMDTENRLMVAKGVGFGGPITDSYQFNSGRGMYLGCGSDVGDESLSH